MTEKDRWTPEDKTRFTMRIDTELFNAIKEIADREKRSAVKQIEYILENWLHDQNPRE